MRIVAGTARGRTLATPRDATTIRPTADRVRESIFNLVGQFFDGGRVLDLFAGTGAMALEALSRGMSSAVLVDSGREAHALCLENARRLGMEARVELLRTSVDRALPALAQRQTPFELVFLDPPYALEVVAALLPRLAPLVSPKGLIVAEHDQTEDTPLEVLDCRRIDRRLMGRTAVSVYEKSRGPSP